MTELVLPIIGNHNLCLEVFNNVSATRHEKNMEQYYLVFAPV
jgi:hypothetical protein